MKFETTITLGNVFQIIALVGAIFSAAFWLSGELHGIDKRITSLELVVERMADYDARLDALERDVLLLKQTP